MWIGRIGRPVFRGAATRCDWMLLIFTLIFIVVLYLLRTPYRSTNPTLIWSIPWNPCLMFYHVTDRVFWNGSVCDWLGGLSGDR